MRTSVTVTVAYVTVGLVVWVAYARVYVEPGRDVDYNAFHLAFGLLVGAVWPLMLIVGAVYELATWRKSK